MDREEADRLALGALSFLISHEEEMSRFLAVSGLQPDTIREAAASPGFFAGILDYVVAYEPLLLAVAKELEAKPEWIMEAHRTLSPSEFD